MKFRKPKLEKGDFDGMTGPQKATYRRAQQARRQRRLPARTRRILALREDGFHVEEVSATHFLVNGRLDLFPTHNTYRDRLTQAQGGHRNLAVFAREWMKQ